MLAVVIADVSVEGEYTFVRRSFGTTGSALKALAEWLVVEQVEEVVMESTAQYWRPVWEVLEESWMPKRRAEAGGESGRLHLAQAQSSRGPRGRKRDYPDAERLVKRLMAQELTLSFVPEPEQRLWRTVMRRKNQLTRNKVQLRNRLECLLEEAHLKLSSLVSDLLGLSARRMMQAKADGETEPTRLAALADRRLRATSEELRDALGASAALNPVYRTLIQMTLEVKTKGSVFQLLYRRLVVRLGHAQAIWAVAHRLCRLIWKILHQGVDYEERGPEVTRERSQRRMAQMIRDLRKLGYHVEPSPQGASA
jgi:hypothetical protein